MYKNTTSVHSLNKKLLEEFMYSNIIADKSLEFSVDIVNLYKVLIEDKKEYILSKQLLRAGTSIGANIRE